MISRHLALLILVTVVVSACSMIYELQLAQCLATLYGNTVLRYSITVGLYLFALGMGALAFDRLSGLSPSGRFLFHLELLLAVCGALSPVLVFSVEALATWGATPSLSFGLVHIWIVVIGFLSGLEVPALLEVSGTAPSSDSSTSATAGILAADFAGTCVGAMMFVMVLYPGLGLIGTAAATGLANLSAAWLLTTQPKISVKDAYRFWLPIVGIALIIAIIWTEESAIRTLIGRLVFSISLT